MGLLSAPPACFFCLTPVDDSKRPNASTSTGGSPARDAARAGASWQCPACGCWNARGADGQIASYVPAMRVPEMNEGSFARRARPSSSHLPPATASPFCRDCTTNQTLVMNLLGNYLPDESDPTYADLAAQLPAYTAGLHARYPPVCASCQPAVDAALKRADQRAQAEAWGRALRQGQAEVDGERKGKSRAVGRVDVGVWRARGGLFVLDAAVMWGVGLSAWIAPDLLAHEATTHTTATTIFLVLRPLAILWAFWDPLWLHRTRHHLSPVGRGQWIIAMLFLLVLRGVAAWLLRAVHLSPVPLLAGADCVILLTAFWRLRREQPVTLTLVRPVAPSPAVPTESVSGVSSLTGLSLSNGPLPPSASTVPPAQTSPKVVFGQPSLNAARDESEPMDWEPTAANGREDWNAFGVGPQRMFPPKQEDTGLETLLASWGIGGSPASGPVPLPSVGQVGAVSATTGHQGRAMSALPVARLANRGWIASIGRVLDDPASALRTVRTALFGLRVLALIGFAYAPLPGPILRALLAAEAATSALSIVASIRSPLPTLIFGCDAALRAMLLVAPPNLLQLPSPFVIPSLSSLRALPTLPGLAPPPTSTDALVCASWAALDAVVLASTLST